MSEHRQEFERFISSPPFEKDIERFPTDASKYSWPGAYCDITVELAWECWSEATSMQIARFESQLAEANARIGELETREALYDEHSDAVKKCLALNKQLVATEKARGAHLKVKIDGDVSAGCYHPTWKLQRIEESERGE